MRSALGDSCHIAIAGAKGAARVLALLVLGSLAVALVAQVAVRWYASGTLSLLPSSPAASIAAPLPVIGGTPAETRAIHEAVAALRYQPPAHSLSIQLVDQPGIAGSLSSYLPGLQLIQVKRSVADLGGPFLQRAIAHEMGHYVDQWYLTDADRAEFMRLRGIPLGTAWVSSASAWRILPSEDFAEVFAVLDVRNVDRPPGTAFGPVRDSAGLEAVLASAKVTLDMRPTAPDWRAFVAQEAALVRYALTDPLQRTLFWLIAFWLAVCGALTEARYAWSERLVTAARRAAPAALPTLQE